MKRFLTLLVMAGFLVVGCAQTRVWTKPDVTRQQFLKDNKSCYVGKAKEQHEEYKSCMRDKGYALVPASTCKVLYPDNTKEQ